MKNADFSNLCSDRMPNPYMRTVATQVYRESKGMKKVKFFNRMLELMSEGGAKNNVTWDPVKLLQTDPTIDTSVDPRRSWLDNSWLNWKSWYRL